MSDDVTPWDDAIDYDDWLNDLMRDVGDASWDGDEGMEQIVTDYVHHLAAEALHLVGCLEKWCRWENGEPCDHGYLSDEVSPDPLRMVIAEVLIEHAMALDVRRQQRTATTWPDESDIYTGTIARLGALYKRKLQAEGWTPPKRGHKGRSEGEA